MSNARTSSDMALEPPSPCSLATARASSSGAAKTPCDSGIRSCTTNFVDTPTASGTTPQSEVGPMPAPTADALRERLRQTEYAARVASIAARLTDTPDQPTAHSLFRAGVSALGAERAAFISFVRDDASTSACHCMLHGDPGWGRRYMDEGHYTRDPWLAYAAHHSEPVLADELAIADPAQHDVVRLAEAAGFVSVLLVPTHSGAGHSRIGLLCLGAAERGCFDGEVLPTLRVAARMLAMELHDWWIARLRRTLIAGARLNSDDLNLLKHQLQGHSSKKIAADLQVSTSSINSRFQRMNARMGVPNRRMAAKLAVDAGLIFK